MSAGTSAGDLAAPRYWGFCSFDQTRSDSFTLLSDTRTR